MAERQSLEEYITQAEQAVEYAKEQLDQGMRQEHYNTMEYSDAQLQLEQAYNDLQTMQQHANDEQREQLNRARMAIRQLQHQMIIIAVDAPDRKHARPAEHLAGFSGILQVDGYGAYAQLAQHADVALAFCWSHVRRQFYEIQVKTPAPIATQALVRIAALYAIEADIRGLSANERRQARQRRTKPLLDDLRLWLEAQLAAVSGKATIAGAMRYTLSRWDGLTRFLDDGRIEIDSNVVERAIRPIALGRKNHLFAGSDGGGEHWAVIASLIETCKMNGVNPQAYLRDVLARIVARHPMGRIDDLLPFAYVSSSQGCGLTTPLTLYLTQFISNEPVHWSYVLGALSCRSEYFVNALPFCLRPLFGSREPGGHGING